MYFALRALSRHRVVNLYGAEGVGKTQLSYAVLHYARDRRLYPQGTFVVDMGSEDARVKGIKALGQYR